ncbi:MAG: AAA family ATPase, partial [Thermoplasmata archaeon]
MKILEILKKEYSELEKGSRLIILEGNEGSGKTHTLNEFCKIIKNDGAICVFLSLSRYPENLNIMPDVDIVKIIENSLPDAQRNVLKNFYYINKEKNMISLITLISSIYKLVIILDDAENTPSVILNNILYLGINHRDKKLMIILSYNPYLISKTMNEFMVKIGTLPNNYIMKIRISSMTFEEAKEISQERGLKLPDYVIEKINQLSNGNLSTFIDITNYLRSKDVIDKDGYFVGNYNDIDTIVVSTLNNYLLSLLSSLGDDDIDFLVSASIVGLNFSKSEIQYLMRIDDERFEKIVENIKRLQLEKIKAKKERPEVNIHMVLCNKNFMLLPKMFEFAYGLNCRNLLIEPIVLLATKTKAGKELLFRKKDKKA